MRGKHDRVKNDKSVVPNTIRNKNETFIRIIIKINKALSHSISSYIPKGTS